MKFRTINEANVSGKRVLVRVDFNVPMSQGKVCDNTRLERHKETICALQKRGAKIILLSHCSRPRGKIVPELSLRPVAKALETIMGQQIFFVEECIGAPVQTAVEALQEGQILLLENLRFYKEEEDNDADFAEALAQQGDLYVNDAFSVSHRAHASVEAITHYLPSYAGMALQRELQALEKGLDNPKKPVTAIVGGAKVSSKLFVLNHLVTKVDYLVIGGGMANNFLMAQGHNVGKSLCEPMLMDMVKDVIEKARESHCTLVLPVDAVVGLQCETGTPHHHCMIEAIPDEGMILDIGEHSIARINTVIDASATLVWNGPLGVFEVPPFDHGTIAVARYAAARSQKGHCVSIAGGGDTVFALNHAGVADDFTYLSTAGGAFLEWMEGKTLPGVLALMQDLKN
ncbi:phosphoglycerate kinase [Bartonella bacilliformis Peru38]|uniref:phosphoglycerate kinase n=1 Tax=Bartonella bacilliformis TaxID=774 RepID=UPI000451F507|nr:phosphoglycerate kinase [Bartonella bacilliformis]EYS95432.1 phosphoglycerate kinase [Bartonella bacilliformis Peru-18]KEG18490.1 phosphoglycerate kinase [Bartonella bacilliformis CUSCO5]KEG22116.1 phosphoglycerate kinase [Bartonella bacilliformis Peru38]KZM38137.1 phosphoglycerate kinase [Bartonella bacilliformis]